METNLEEKNIDYRTLGVSGLGGWLILVQIGIYSTMILLLIQLFSYNLPSLSPDALGVLTSKQSEFYHPLWAIILPFEAVYNLAYLLFCGLILFYFYRKKATLPRLMIIFYSSSLIMAIIALILIYQIPLARELEDGSLIRDIVKAIITCSIWIPYFLKSERVQNTFIR